MNTIKVLIADDEAFTAEAVRGILVLSDENRFEVEIENDHRRVLERIRSWKPHVVLLDDQFQGKKIGISRILPQIRGEFLAIGIIIITAHRGHDVAPVARSLPFEIDGFLDKTRDKSFEPDQLRKAVVESFNKFLERNSDV